MGVSNRSKAMIQPSLVKYNGLIQEVAKTGKKVYFLNVGQPDIPTPPQFMDAVCKIDEEVLQYGDAKGLPLLRENIVRYFKKYDIDYTPDEILITMGGSEALLYAFLTLCDPGDEIICPEPTYSIYLELAKTTNVNLVPMNTLAETGFELPGRAKIEALITDKTKAFIINSPANPMGRVYTQREMDDIAYLANKYDLQIVSDEVYREFVYDGLEYLSFAARKDVENRVILVDSASKRFSACGIRVGFMATKDEQVYEGLLKNAQTKLCVSYVDQVGAAALFELDNDYLAAQVKEYEQRRDAICEELGKIDGVLLKKPHGSFHMLVQLPVDDAGEFIQFMLNEFTLDGETILITPAEDFYQDKRSAKQMVRISYVLKEKDLRRAMYILKKGIEAYNNRA